MQLGYFFTVEDPMDYGWLSWVEGNASALLMVASYIVFLVSSALVLAKYADSRYRSVAAIGITPPILTLLLGLLAQALRPDSVIQLLPFVSSLWLFALALNVFLGLVYAVTLRSPLLFTMAISHLFAVGLFVLRSLTSVHFSING